MTNAPKALKLESEPLWNQVNELSEYLHAKLADMPEEEKWDTTSKLRMSIVNLLLTVGEALGNGAPNSGEFGWGNARRSAAGLKTIYRYAGRQKFIDLEPEIMVKLDSILTTIDEQLAAAYQQTAAKEKQDLDYWRELYRLSLGCKK